MAWFVSAHTHTHVCVCVYLSVRVLLFKWLVLSLGLVHYALWVYLLESPKKYFNTRHHQEKRSKAVNTFEVKNSEIKNE